MKNRNLYATVAAAMMILQTPTLLAGEATIEVPDLRGKLQYAIDQHANETVRADIEARTEITVPAPVAADVRYAFTGPVAATRRAPDSRAL